MRFATFPRVQSAFVNDAVSAEMSRIQDRQFLRTGVKPIIGQRVELFCQLTPEEQFRLSGQVVEVLPEPSVWRPQCCPCPACPLGGSFALTHYILPQPAFLKDFLPKLADGKSGSYYPCTCGNPECHGELYLTPESWTHTEPELKERCAKAAIEKFGFKHGQKIVVQARLNFDQDIRRGTEEGPWADIIPLDGRDIWEYTLVADDSKYNMLEADMSSFRNLGRNVQPRCWPWSLDRELPFQRQGVDFVFPLGMRRGMTLCIGPFGCPNTGHHSHWFATQLAKENTKAAAA